MSSREERIKKFGHEVIKDDETTWRKRGYKVNQTTGLLEQIKKSSKSKALKKKLNVKSEGRPMYFEKTMKRGIGALHAR